MTARARTRARGEAGQSLLEFALVFPIFLAVLLGMVDIGRAVWANNAVANAAREAARYAAIHGGTKANPCPVGPPGEDTVIPAASTDCPYPSPSKEGIRDVARSHAIAVGVGLSVEVCYGSGCSGDTDVSSPEPATNERGTAVTVRVASQVPMIIGDFLGINPIGVSATSTMLVNH
ncbi:MAG: pilus assembly protein [Chloroflexi bacterium]|nr:pilus assembly protein [Chloroflexota bacterium]